MSHMRIAARTYLVVMQHVFIAKDLGMTIADHDPAAKLIIAATHAEAAAALHDVTHLELAFIADAPTQFVTSDLANAIRLRGGRIVLLGAAATPPDGAGLWAVLEMPFTTEVIRKYLD